MCTIEYKDDITTMRLADRANGEVLLQTKENGCVFELIFVGGARGNEARTVEMSPAVPPMSTKEVIRSVVVYFLVLFEVWCFSFLFPVFKTF